jgi:hypothetical protein
MCRVAALPARCIPVIVPFAGIVERTWRHACALLGSYPCRANVKAATSDCLNKNLLLGPAGYVAVDPRPLLGDPCCDVGFFAASYRPAAHIVMVARRRTAGLRCGAGREVGGSVAPR